jgi:hypothetical protein
VSGYLIGATGALIILLIEWGVKRVIRRVRASQEVTEKDLDDVDEATVRALMNIPDDLPVVKGDDGTWYVITGDHDNLQDVRRDKRNASWVDDVKDAIALGRWWSTEIDGVTHRVGTWRGCFYPMCTCRREPLHPDHVESHPMGLGPAVTCERCLT